MARPGLIIFDCDGVLVDSEVLSATVLITELASLGIVIDQDHVRRHFLGRSFPTVARILRETQPVALPDDLEQRYRAALLARFETELRPTPGVAAVLETLDLPKCVATSSSPPRVAKSLEVTGLARFFGQAVFTASQVARGKPFPDLFLFAARQMGHDPDAVLVIEDSLPGIEAARAAGMAVLAYAGGAHLRGRADTLPADVPRFDNWADLPHLLTTFRPDPEAP